MFVKTRGTDQKYGRISSERLANPEREFKTIKEMLDTDDGINFHILKNLSQTAPLGKGWVCIAQKQTVFTVFYADDSLC
jgi:hypothetical protein